MRAARVACAPVNRIDEVAEFLGEHSSLPATYRAGDTEAGVLRCPIRIDGDVLDVRSMPLDPGADNEAVLGPLAVPDPVTTTSQED